MYGKLAQRGFLSEFCKVNFKKTDLYSKSCAENAEVAHKKSALPPYVNLRPMYRIGGSPVARGHPDPAYAGECQ